jgi:hypothetical protein
MGSRRLATTLGVAVLLGLTALTGVAVASHVTCGQVITASTTLDSDVGPCPGDGLEVAGDGVTLSLGGHHVLGRGSGTGILVSGEGVHVRNGTVSGFSDGVLTFFSSNDTIEGLVATRNATAGIALGPGLTSRLERNIVTANGAMGIRINQTTESVVERNLIRGNGGPGVYFGGGSTNFRTQRNTLRANAVDGNGGDGVLLERRADGNEMVGNRIARNGRDGVHISVFSADQCCDLVQGNVIVGNAGNGVLIERDRPGTLTSDLRNRILENRAFRNELFDLADENPGCDANTWAGNRFGTRNQPCIN